MNEIVKKGLQKIKQERHKIKNEVKDRTITYIAGGLGAVAGIAWSNLINSTIEYIFPWKAGSLLAKFLYAILITLIVVSVTVYLAKLSSPEPPK